MRIVNPTAVLGEDAACEFLKQKGYRIIERNFRKSHTEIDIIAIFGSLLVFVEVKSRSSDTYGTPFESIPLWKVRNLVKTAQFYKLLHPDFPEDMRIDAIGVYINGNRVYKIEQIENISGF